MFLQSCVAKALSAKIASTTLYKVWRNTTSVMKIFFDLMFFAARWLLVTLNLTFENDVCGKNY